MISTALVALGPCVIWFIVTFLAWALREGFLTRATPDEVAANTRIAVLLTAATVLNLVAVVVFLLKSRGYGWWLLVVVSIADAMSLGLWLVLGNYTDSASIVILGSGAATGAVTTVLLLAFRFWPRLGPVPARPQ